MNSYNTTTISNLFAYLYSLLRRVYTQYAVNYGAKQLFVYGNVTLKRPDRIPYFFSVEGARLGNYPDGYLPTDISPYYFRERPIYFYDKGAFLDQFASGKYSLSNTNNPPYLILNILIGGSYRDVFVRYESAKMNISLYASDAINFVTQEAGITELQKSLSDIITQICIAYNQVKLLENAKAQGKYNNDNFLYRAKYGAKVQVTNWITSLQGDSRFVVKVCAECGNNAQLGDITTAITYIVMAGALSLYWVTSQYNYADAKNYLDNLAIDVDRLRIDLDDQWKGVQTPGYKPTDSGAKPMQTATVTAKISSVPSWLWWVLGGVGVIAITGKKEKKEK